ncbi:MAG TPA: UDP-N-acetylmuramate dehydrogenase [Saprospiraceae bacterium]|nr:UDP-N-acetylmuramate dehydrogenase [Saprospiraceae bacterium]
MFQKNVSLQPFHTFGIDVKTESFAPFHSQREFKSLFAQAAPPIFILGGGSNILFTQDFKGTVLKNNIRTKRIGKSIQNQTLVHIGAGVNWHQFVRWAIRRNLGGVENLSLIPGTVGAAPIQNIGAYGVELKDVFAQAKCIVIKPLDHHGQHYLPGDFLTVSRDEAQFGYRHSIFKSALKGKVVIVQVSLLLTNKNHIIHTDYGAISKELAARKIKKPTIQDVSDAIIAIRESKLPNPKKIGNSGSFFKNPYVPIKKYQELKEKYPNIPAYPIDDNTVKLAAGWLIQEAGWKGYRDGDAGCYDKQALVLVNYGQAKGEEIWQLAQKIQNSVKKKFGLLIEPEVNIL